MTDSKARRCFVALEPEASAYPGALRACTPTWSEQDSSLEIRLSVVYPLPHRTATLLILQHLNPSLLTSIDLYELIILIASKRYRSGNVAYLLMNISALGFSYNSFDAVFDFGSLHHLPDWRKAIEELKRVLVPGGQLILEDLSIESFSGFPGRAYRPLMIHPYRQMYTVDQFVGHAKRCGFTITHLRRSNPLGLVKFFHLAARA